jgi:hypothetical protein
MKRRDLFARRLPASRRRGVRLHLDALEDRTAPAVFTVTNTADSGPGSLRQAVLAANAATGADIIAFDATLFTSPKTVQMTGGVMTITDPVTIQGPAAGLTLDAGGLSGHFALSMTNPLDPVSLSGLTLTRAGGDYGSASLANLNASLTLSKMVITDCINGGISVGAPPSGWGWFYNPGSVAKLSLTDSTVSDNSAGGINITNGDADIRRSTISGNSGDSGGGIGVGALVYAYYPGVIGLDVQSQAYLTYLISGSLTLTDSTVNDNTATHAGGGIDLVSGQVKVVNSTIAGNVAGFSEGGGGGINVRTGSLTVQRSTISGNSADVGGGISVGYGYGYGYGSNSTVDDSTISRNKANTVGGGVSLYATDALFRNSTISGNAVSAGPSARGAGLAASASELDMQNSTVAFNTAGPGSGGGIDNTKSDIRLRNVILSNNVAWKAGPDLNGTANVDFSLVDNTSGALITGGNNLLDIDARLGPLADNGGPTRTHRPGAGSPVRNAGGEVAGTAADQRGAGFPRVLQGRADIGAVESVDPSPIAVATVPAVTVAGGKVYIVAVTYSDDTAIQVSSLGTGDISVYGGGYGGGNYFSVAPTFVWVDVNSNGTPRMATYVFTPPGGAWGPEDNGDYTVYVNYGQVSDSDATPHTAPSGVIGKIAVRIPTTFVVDQTSDVDTSGKLSLRNAIALANQSPGTADTIVFSPAVFGTARTIALTGGELMITDPVTIIGPTSGLTLDAGSKSRLFQIDTARPGDAVSISGLTLTNGSADAGGAILNVDAALSLSRMVVTGNVAGYGGGGIRVSGGALALVDSTVSGNRTKMAGRPEGGGGIYAAPETSVTVSGSTISGNSSASNGGAMFVLGTSLTVSDSTVSSNTAFSYGGGLYMSSATTALVRNSTIAYNAAPYGGGIYCYGLPTIESTIVAKNTGGTGPDLYGQAKATFCLIGNTSGMVLYTGSSNNLLNRDPLLGPLADNGGRTQTHALLLGSPAVNSGSNPASLSYDQRGNGFARVVGTAADIGAFEVPPATVSSVVVNAGQANRVQRSTVTSLTVTFGGLVTFVGPAASAFQLRRTGPGGTLGDVTLAVDLSGSTATQTVARLTFSGALTEGANSLVDGNYTLKVLSGGVNVGILGGDNVTSLFRLFGDVNGDKAVNGLDLTAFRTAFGASNGDASYRPELDFDGDGDVNGSDLAVFRTRFGATLP